MNMGKSKGKSKNVEKSNSVDQIRGGQKRVGQKRLDQKLAAVKGLLAAQPELFRRQGVVVGTWRTVEDRQLGPYYALRYRAGLRQRAVYLGKSEQLAANVQQLLNQLQKSVRQQRRVGQLRQTVRKSLRHHKVEWGKHLESELGLMLKGYEVRVLKVLEKSLGRVSLNRCRVTL